jgi:MYXO-CTERM domain-containing protein
VKVLVLSFSNLDPLTDGVVLYTCDVTVAGGTAPGDYAIDCENAGGSDPTGNTVDTTCADGTVTVPDVPVAEISVGDGAGAPGDTISIDIALNLLDSAAEVAATENVLTFGAETQITGCAVNPNIMREASAFSFSPSGCTAGTDCESVKALVLSFSNLDPLADGTVLYSCDIALAGGSAAATLSGATGSYTIGCAEPGSSDPSGAPLSTTCSDGTVSIVVPDTPTVAPTLTPVPTDTPFVEPTDTPEPVATPTEGERDPTNTPREPLFSGEDDGCAVVASQPSASGWMLLMPLAGLLWLRRRR